jgi:hypothetical protein
MTKGQALGDAAAAIVPGKPEAGEAERSHDTCCIATIECLLAALDVPATAGDEVPKPSQNIVL